MNRLSQQLTLDRHVSFNEKIRAMTIKVFGREEAKDCDLAEYSYCPITKTHTYRYPPLFKQLAKRHLLNPIKQLRFLFSCLSVLPLWFLERYAHTLDELIEETYLKSEIKTIIVNAASFFALNLTQPLLIVGHTLKRAMVRILVAPTHKSKRTLHRITRTQTNSVVITKTIKTAGLMKPIPTPTSTALITQRLQKEALTTAIQKQTTLNHQRKLQAFTLYVSCHALLHRQLLQKKGVKNNHPAKHHRRFS